MSAWPRTCNRRPRHRLRVQHEGMESTMRRITQIVVVAAVLVGILALAPSCSPRQGDGSAKEFRVESKLESARIRYAPSPPTHVYDSVQVEIALSHDPSLPEDSLALELLPARGGWSMPVDSFLVRDTEGWYRGRIWVCPTESGEFLVRWQTYPFTGFTFHLAARYDSSGTLRNWDNEPVAEGPNEYLVPRDTMEFVYTYWPHVWYRRVHLIRRPDMQNTYWIITQSLERSAGVSAREIWPSANLTLDSAYPLRPGRWSHPGWVVDTLLVTVRRDTMVASIDWTYQEFVDNWEKNYSLFRDWEHKRSPNIHFQLNTDGHVIWASKHMVGTRRNAAKLAKVAASPPFDSLRDAFIKSPPAAGDTD